jgi:tRNA(fMet)-specific endonuclease VapC
VVPIDADTGERYGLLHDHLRRQGTPIPVNGLWIAASAAQHGLRLATFDAHFLSVPGLLVEFLGESDAVSWPEATGGRR